MPGEDERRHPGAGALDGTEISDAVVRAYAQWKRETNEAPLKPGGEQAAIIMAAPPKEVMDLVAKYGEELPPALQARIQAEKKYRREIDEYVEANFEALNLVLGVMERPPGGAIAVEAGLVTNSNLNKALNNPDIVARVKEMRKARIMEQGERARRQEWATSIMDGLPAAVTYAKSDATFRSALKARLEQSLKDLGRGT